MVKTVIREKKYTKWYNQKDDTSCGPLAIYNILERYKIKKPSLRFLKKKCKDDKGTSYNNFTETLMLFNVQISAIKIYPKLFDIRDFLNTGGIVVLNYYWENGKESGIHYSILTDITPFSMTIVNDIHYKTRNITNREVKSLLKKYHNPEYEYLDSVYPKAWFIK